MANKEMVAMTAEEKAQFEAFQKEQAVAVEFEGVAAIGALALDVVIGGHRHLVAGQQAGHIASQLLYIQAIEGLIVDIAIGVKGALVQVQEIVVERDDTGLDAVVAQHVVEEPRRGRLA